MRRLARWSVMALASLALLGVSLPAGAEPSLEEKETARALFREGDEHFREGDFKGALERFAAADDIMNLPTTKIERGRSLMMLGRLIEARDAFVGVGLIPAEDFEPEAQVNARREARELAEQTATRIPTILVEVTGIPEYVPVRVLVDGQEVALSLLRLGVKVDPGKRLLRAEAPDYVTREALVDVKEGESRRITLDLRSLAEVAADPKPKSAAPEKGGEGEEMPSGDGSSSSTWLTVGFVGLGVGVVGMVQGAV
ncbi:MAG: hypothetical protein KC731_31390, partial [Myxococcales bacterium]|nr:hypothetical protein [Myxococcales bacterium]